MNLSPYKISEKFVLKKLNFIQDGKLILENYDGKIHQFGINETTLNAKIKIHNPKSVSYTHLTLPTNREV